MSQKKLRLIYNPYAGRRRMVNQLDEVIRIFQEGGYEVRVHRTKSPEDIEHTAAQSKDVDTLVIAGGDGSVHQVVNGLMKIPAEKRPVLGILPVGTANDLAYAIKLPKSIPAACKVIVQDKTFEMDLGKVNERYFVNVASAGMLTDVSTKVDIRVKNSLGQLAYYLKGIETLPSFRPFHVEFAHEGRKYSEDALLLLAVNGLSVGGFRQLVPRASLIDGKLDFLLVKLGGWPETMRLLLKVVGGGKVECDKIIHFQTEYVRVTCDRELSSDLDGELGPDSPWEIAIGPKIKVLC
ncbi:diacylglycerol/lipid kinase family protein [Desulfitobacterium metallireducens]|uniref:Lipid kinase n=1 Tax=Desulfitobacterium metallireducens DSM 15288 TaxID=871968 RepID=W0EBE1_9FIRM|nr:diacylglycerol kinase family protein [Desulfitobacterium metallireducens]AHF06534.1 lipid kinase [Desulfitobacterium metallireducens DSM 15288]